MINMTDFAEVFARLAQAGTSEEISTSGGVNTRMVRIAARYAGRWDSHGHTAETVVVWSGDFHVEFRDHTLSLAAGQCCVVPVNTEHRGTSRDGAEIVLFTHAASIEVGH